MVFSNYFCIVLYLCIQSSYCYWNRSVFIYDYWPGETCDLNDPWNQSKFGGVELPLLHKILKNTKLNESEFALYCICCYSDVFEAYGSEDQPSPYDYYFTTFDAWATAAGMSNQLFRESQPYHELEFGVGVLYEEPSWIFFKYFDYKVLIYLFMMPIIIGVLFSFYDPKFAIQYQVSNYLGLIFFQPEILVDRKISTKVISWFLELVSLIVLGVFTSKLQEALDDMKTYGNRTLDNGLADVFVYAEQIFYKEIAMSTLMNPIKIQYDWWTYSDLTNEMIQHPGATFEASKSFLEMAMLQICSLHYVGGIFMIHNVFHQGRTTKEDFLSLNAAIIDSVEFGPIYFSTYNYTEIILPENIKCKTKNTAAFQYSIRHLHELWYLYLCGILLASIFAISEFCHLISTDIQKVSKIYEKRLNYNLRCIKDKLHLSFIWLMVYQQNFMLAGYTDKLRIVRQHLIEKKSDLLTKAMKTRSKVVKDYLKRNKGISLRIILKSLISFARAMKPSKLGGRSSTKKIPLKKIINKFPKSKKKGKQLQISKRNYFKVIANESLKDSLVKAIEFFKITNHMNYQSKLQKMIYKYGFFAQHIVQLKDTNSAHFSIDSSFHSNLQDVFFNKIADLILQNLLKGKKQVNKVRKHKDQFSRLIEANYNESLAKLFKEFHGAIKFILKKRKFNKNKLKLVMKGGINTVPILTTKFIE